MDLYNSIIKETRSMLSAAVPRVWAYDPAGCWKDTGANELVLQREAAFELGASGKGSANYILFTSDSSLVGEDRVLLYGKDITELKENCDFARIVLLRVGMLDGDDEVIYRTLKDIEFAKYHVYPEGYMVRISPEAGREQVRVSKQAVKRGISFRALGSSYIREYKKNINVLNAAVIFVTQPGMDYGRLQELAKLSGRVTGTLTHILEGLPADCSICALKDICDEVEGMKELHFGVGDKGTKGR